MGVSVTIPTERCYVYRLPERLTQGYCFDGGHPILFRNVDWFDTPKGVALDQVTAFIKKKPYYEPKYRYLVLYETGSAFTITGPA